METLQEKREKYDFTESIINGIEKRKKEYFESPGWIQDAIKFNGDLYLRTKKKVVIEKLFDTMAIGGYKRAQKLLDLEVLINNLILQKKKPISISLNRNHWKINRYNKVSYYIIDLIHHLQKHDFLKLKIGYNTENESRLTRIWATEKLFDFCGDLHFYIILKPIECVIKKDKKKNPIEYRDTARTIQVRNILEHVNRVNQKVDIRCQALPKNPKLNVILKAVFIERFTQHGRLYSYGNRYFQGLSKEHRKSITINGDKTVELDFSALHPRLLYAAEGIQYDEDPYTVVHNDPELRSILKKVLLLMLNAESKKTPYEYLYKKYSLVERLGITETKNIVEGFYKAHSPIAKYFCQGSKTGFRLTNIDSKIALDVTNHFAKQNIPILPVHDSFIVQEPYKEELREIMQQMYAKHTGGFTCRI